MFDPGSRARLTEHDRGRFPGESLLDRVGRAVCAAGCLPRKELLESWEVARRVRRRLRGGRVVDLACGHGLLAHLLLLLDASSPAALAVDTRLPASAARIREALAARWPEVVARVELRAAPLESVALGPGDLVVAAHACGDLTDRLLAAALAARARVAVLPCCNVVDRQAPSGLEGWLGGTLAVDVARAHRLAAAGYDVHAQTIPAAVTPRNRLLLAWPRGVAAAGHPSG